MILEYFGEDPDLCSITGECCDVCSCTSKSVVDCSIEMQTVIKATSDLTGKGEKKVRTNVYYCY